MGCDFLTETDETPWRDCLYASGVMLAHDAGVTLPLGYTKAEREALERSDDRPDEQGGSLDDLMTGFRRRYDWTPTLAKDVGNATFRGSLTGGAVVQIIYAELPAHFQQWDPAFAAKGADSRHSVSVRRSSSVDGSTKPGYLWLRDPLARGAYCGEWIRETDLLVAANAWNGAARVDAILAPVTEVTDVYAVQTQTPFAGGNRHFSIPAGTTIRAYSVAQPGKVVKQSTFASRSGASASHRVAVQWFGGPAAVPTGYPFLLVADGMFAGLLIVEAMVELAPDPPPVIPEVKHKVALAVDGVIDATSEREV